MSLKWELIAPAKINLGLKILYRFNNGYHYLVTPMAQINLYDILLLEESNNFSLNLRSELPSHFSKNIERSFQVLPDGSYENILYKTYTILKDELKNSGIPPLHIEVIKRIPSPSGLGGASSDAAQLLLFFNQWLKLSESELIQHALKIGSDVPFFLKPKPALVEKIGERIYDLPLKNFSGYLGIPPYGFPTKEMYALLKKGLQGEIKGELVRLKALEELGTEMGWLLAEGVEKPLELESWEKHHKPEGVVFLNNDFWPAICQNYPKEAGELKEAQESLANELWQRKKATIAVSLSGSGGAIYALSEGGEEKDLLPKLKNKFPAFLWYPIEGLI